MTTAIDRRNRVWAADITYIGAKEPRAHQKRAGIEGAEWSGCCSCGRTDFDDEMSTATEPQIDADQLEVSRSALRDRTYWRLAPVIACDVQLGSLEQVSSANYRYPFMQEE
jgi:hypothetical protein